MVELSYIRYNIFYERIIFSRNLFRDENVEKLTIVVSYSIVLKQWNGYNNQVGIKKAMMNLSSNGLYKKLRYSILYLKIGD